MYIEYKNKKIFFDDCTTFSSRLIGFMFTIQKIKKGKRFPKCNSIHTFFMFQKIDVIMTDKNNKIIKLYSNLKPNRIIFPKKYIYYTYEFPLETAKNYHIGDILEIKEDKS